MSKRTTSLRVCCREGCANLVATTTSTDLCGTECRKWSHARAKGKYREKNRATINAAGREYAAARYVPYRTIIRCKTEGCHNLYLWSSGRAGYCGGECRRTAANAASGRWAKANPEKRLAFALKRYGLTPETYRGMLAAQGGGCYLCGSVEPGGAGRFHVDHDHKCCPGSRSCGRCVRRLLCNECNTGLGKLHDDPDLMRRAADYIESFRR